MQITFPGLGNRASKVASQAATSSPTGKAAAFTPTDGRRGGGPVLDKVVARPGHEVIAFLRKRSCTSSIGQNRAIGDVAGATSWTAIRPATRSSGAGWRNFHAGQAYAARAENIARYTEGRSPTRG